MLRLTQVIETFPSVRIPSNSGGLDVEVSLIAQLGHGAGNHLFASVASRQSRHEQFIDELDEPSARLGGTNFSKGDPTSLYSFVVGPRGHPFHRHAGHRIFTAISGSGGAQLRFSSASNDQIEEDPKNFINALRFINIPPDCLFAVRFGGETWHQFYPLARNSLHPVFFALSCHTNELGGNLSDALKEKVLANDANIPSLTELLPPAVAALLNSEDFRIQDVPTTTLALDAPEGTLHRTLCNTVRGSAGFIRGSWGRWRDASGFMSLSRPERTVVELNAAPPDSLLRRHLADKTVDHEDTFSLTIEGINLKGVGASRLLAMMLEGFLLNAPAGVSYLMKLRNTLVKPIGLRTSPLGCPVSSLLSPRTNRLFAGQYPVLDEEVNAADTVAQVVLGADDKHLSFRSCICVKIINDNSAEFTLGTRVHCKNLFGKFYITSIDYVHRRYITPTMLRYALEYVVAQAALNERHKAAA